MRNALVRGLVLLAAAAPAFADTTVLHVVNNISNWRGSWNSSPAYAWLDNWPNAGADGSLAEFSRTALQTAINNQIAATGAWDAKVIVSQVTWTGNPAIPADLGPVAASVDVDASTFKWGTSYAYNAGNGSWMFGGATYANFVAVVNAGVAAGKSYLVDNPNWQAVWDTGLAAPLWDVVIDVPEYLITHYINNTAAEGIFVGAKIESARYVAIYGTDQWGGTADMRVVIAAQPTTAPWLAPNVQNITRTMHLGDPTATVPVTVNNAGSGTLAWTASESPDVGWITLANASGGNGGVFNVQINMTGQTPGTFTTTIRVADPGAGNTPVIIPVTITLFQTAQPVIQLVPSTVSYGLRPTDPVPTGQMVTVNNIGFGSLAWTATVRSPAPGWLSLFGNSGGNGGWFLVLVNHTGLGAGQYTGYVDVVDLNAANSPQTVTVTLTVRDQDANITKANSYDDTWETGVEGWVINLRNVKKYWSGKTAGFVLHVGDSITYANPFGQWPRAGSGKTAEDTTICNWMHAANWGPNPPVNNISDNGWYLAAADVTGRGGSYTAKSGIRADQYLAGNYSLPSCDQMFTTGFTNPDGKQYRDGQICVVMLGTNDASSNRTTAAYSADMQSIVNKLLAADVLPVLSTLPPKRNDMTDVQNYNAAVRSIAQSKKIPVIDYYEECLRRRPGNTWDNTLISGDGVHPSSTGGAYTSSSDPYASSGAALSEVGYLLRSWLSVQKIKEIKTKVVDAPAQRDGDVDYSGFVDIFDVIDTILAFGSTPGTANWNPGADFDANRIVDVLDVMDAINAFGT